MKDINSATPSGLTSSVEKFKKLKKSINFFNFWGPPREIKELK